MKWRYARYFVEHVCLPGIYVGVASMLWNQLVIPIRLMCTGVFMCLLVGIPQCLLVLGLFHRKCQYSVTLELPITTFFWLVVAVNAILGEHNMIKQVSTVNTFNQITNTIFHIVLVSNTLCYVFVYIIMLLWGVFVLLLNERPIVFPEIQPVRLIGGLRFSQIERLQIIQLSQSRIDKDEQVICAICLQQFTVESELIKLNCTHTFHKDCIAEWLSENHICPYCRAVVQPNTDPNSQIIQPNQFMFWTVPQLILHNDE